MLVIVQYQLLLFPVVVAVVPLELLCLVDKYILQVVVVQVQVIRVVPLNTPVVLEVAGVVLLHKHLVALVT